MWPFTPRNRNLGEPLSHSQSWSPPFRTIAVINGGADWWNQEGMEEINPDFPSLCPLFHNICARMPSKWTLGYITHCADRHEADFHDDNGAYYSLYFGGFEDGLLFQLSETRKANREGVREFLLALNKVLDATDGIDRVEWHAESMFDSGCLRNQYELYGMPSPLDEVADDR